MEKRQIENVKNYQNLYSQEFAKYWLDTFEYIPEDNDFKEEMKQWFSEEKSIKVDYRYKVFNEINHNAFELLIERC